MSEYESSFLSLNFPAIRLITFEADGPAPSVQEKTSGLKETFSTSRIRCSYLSFFSCSCILYASLMSLGQVFACGLKILTSKKVLENLFSHRPLARMSRRASSSVVVLLFAKASPCKVWRQGSTSTSSHTSFRRLANESRMSLCLIWVYPPFGQCSAWDTVNGSLHAQLLKFYWFPSVSQSNAVAKFTFC